MKKNLLTLCAVSLLAATVVSCQHNVDGNEPLGKGMARLSFNVNTSAGFVTKALNEDNWKNAANYTVEVINSANEVVETYAPGEALPNYLALPFGTYTINASYGTEETASRTTFLSKGSTTVSLQSGDEKTASLTCAPTCGKVKVQFDAEMDTYFTDYYVTYSTPALGIDYVTWAKADTDPWYLLVDKNGSTIAATIHLVAKAEYDLNKTNTSGSTPEGTVKKTYNLQPNKSWTLKIAPNYSTSYGTLGITIEVDESTNDIEKDIVVPSEWI